MSDASEQSELWLGLADYASLDSNGKANVVGGYIDGLPILGEATPRFSILAEVRVPVALCPVDITVEILLVNEEGEVVELPMSGPTQPVQAMRLAQVMSVDRPGRAPNGALHPQRVAARQSVAVDFNTGLPIAPGTYGWRLRIDGDDVNAHIAWFYVFPQQPTPPVFG